MLEEILAYNKQFVENKGYESYITNKYPDKKIAILPVWTPDRLLCFQPH